MTTRNAEGLTFSELKRRQLHDSYHRLGQFLHAGPQVMVEQEVAMLLLCTVRAYGPGVMANLGERIIKSARIDAGFCVLCKGEPNFAGHDEPVPICPACLAPPAAALDYVEGEEVTVP